MTALAEPMTEWPTLYRAAEVVDVNHSQGILELLVIPYERQIEVPHPFKLNGGRVLETISRGAFDGIEGRPNRVKVNRDHDERDTIGRATRFHPRDPAGLRAEVKISQTDRGRETLTLVADGCLEVSAGFRPKDQGLQWERSNAAYRITKAWLRHIALVPEPAYEDARVLAMRAAELARMPSEATGRPLTPVLDRLHMSEWVERERALDTRWRAR